MAYSYEDEKANSGGLFDPNRSKSKGNKIAALQSYIGQNQTSQGPNVVANKVAVDKNVNKDITKAQGSGNAFVVQQVGAVNNNVAANTTGSTVAKTAPTTFSKLDPNNKGPKPATISSDALQAYGNGNAGDRFDDNGNVVKDFTYEGSSFDKALGKETEANKAVDTASYKHIADDATAINQAYADKTKELTTQLGVAGDELSKFKQLDGSIGNNSELEQGALDRRDALVGGSGNVGVLQNMFGGNYNAGLYGGLDSQIYNGDLNTARDEARIASADAGVEQNVKKNAVQSYLTALQQGRTSIDEFGKDFGAKLTGIKDKSLIDNTTSKTDLDADIKARDSMNVDLAKSAYSKDAKLFNNLKAFGEFTKSQPGSAGRFSRIKGIFDKGNINPYINSTDTFTAGMDFNTVEKLYQANPSNEFYKDLYGQLGYALKTLMAKDKGIQSRDQKIEEDVSRGVGSNYGTSRPQESGAGPSTPNYGSSGGSSYGGMKGRYGPDGVFIPDPARPTYTPEDVSRSPSKK